MYNTANLLTFCRIVCIPLLVALFYSPYEWRYLASAGIFGIAGLTDWADGYVARKYGQTTALGAFLDPVADKLMVAVALALLIEHYANLWFTLPAAVIICREIVISALREWMAEIGRRSTVSVSMIGKIKTTAQIIAILLLLAFPKEQFTFADTLGYITLYIAATLTLWSMIVYLRAAWPSLKQQ